MFLRVRGVIGFVVPWFHGFHGFTGVIVSGGFMVSGVSWFQGLHGFIGFTGFVVSGGFVVSWVS